jgi:hypothetical protein
VPKQRKRTVLPGAPVHVEDLVTLAIQQKWAKINGILHTMNIERIRAFKDYLEELVESELYVRSPPLKMQGYQWKDYVYSAQRDLHVLVSYIVRVHDAYHHFEDDLQQREF